MKRSCIPCMLRAASVALIACVASAQTPQFKDNEQPIPVDYKGWPKFLSNVQRPDVRQVREIYINPVGAAAKEGQPFPAGTILVMENYAAKLGADGIAEKDADGRLVKGNLLRIFVMGKGEGWGNSAPQGLRNGDWVYAAYGVDGTLSGDPIAPCRSCHLPLAQKDYVPRYDEYFVTHGH